MEQKIQGENIPPPPKKKKERKKKKNLFSVSFYRPSKKHKQSNQYKNVFFEIRHIRTNHSITCIKRLLKGSNESGLLQQGGL